LILIRQNKEAVKRDVNRKLFAQTPEELTIDVAVNLFGEKAEELILMPRGYAGKFLEVDLSSGNIKDVTFSEEILKNFVGGRGLVAKILWERFGENWESIDPLGPENLFLALTGPMTAIYPGARICISGKSPQCNGIIGSTLSGEFPVDLKCAGYDGVIVSGKAEKPVYILVTDDHAEIRDAKHVWGKEAIDTIRILNKEVRELLEEKSPNAGKSKEPSMIYCGPTGESRIRTAAVLQKVSHAAGYGGYGAVMGSKNLKAIVAKGRKPLPDVANPVTVKMLWREVDRRYCRRDRTFPGLWGTGYGGYSVGAGASSEPVRNLFGTGRRNGMMRGDSADQSLTSDIG